MVTTLDEYLTLSLTRCKALGFFAPNTVQEGRINWKTSDGEQVGAILFTTDTVNHTCTLHYSHNGNEVKETVRLRWRSSNLDQGVTWEKGRGFYYFVCPVTGRSCRKLYLVNGRFVSRHAFKALYEQQVYSRSRRNDIFRFLDYADKLEKLEQQPRRKYTYRGKPTPFARKVERLNRRGAQWYARLNNEALNG